MTYFTPKYFDEFFCRAGACPDSCCRAGWEIPIDPETYEFYKFTGIDVDKNSYIDPDGDRAFKLKADRTCPFFRADGLCEIYVRTDGRLCEICAKYPRFFEEYDGFAEAGISVSCPTAAELILSQKDNPYIDLQRESSDCLLDFLVTARERAMDMIYSEDDPDVAAAKLYGYGMDLQELIDSDELEAIDNIGFEPAELIGERELAGLRRFIREETEILNSKWRELIESNASYNTGTQLQKRNYLAYLTYRYSLKAINTEDIYAECAFITALYRLAGALGENYIETVRLISKEIDHNADNYDAILNLLAD